MIIIYDKEKEKVQELVDKILQEHPEYGDVNVIGDLSELPEDLKIEVKEEDLDDVIENYIHENFGERWDGCVPVGCFELDSMAEHFYMLGFNARKYGDTIKVKEVDLRNNGWIDCTKQMPPETKQISDTLQGHREWTESDRVLVWDSMYGCSVDVTKNGKWMSEQRGGYKGQVVHGIIAWRPIPEFIA